MTVQICGMAPSRKAIDLGKEAWGLPWDPLSHRYSVWFEMHDRSLWSRRGHEYIETLRTSEVPIYMQRHYDDIPASVAFPVEQVAEVIGADYFNSSIAYMLGLAILQSRDIEVWGVDNHTDSEWWFERPCNEYLIGVARGKGLNVWIHPDSSLTKFMPDIHFNGEIQHYKGRYGWL